MSIMSHEEDAICLLISAVYMFYVVKVKGGTFTKDDSYEKPEMGCV